MRILPQSFLLALATALPAPADPITNVFGRCFNARWIASNGTDCDRVCRAESLQAESIPLSSASGAQRIFACRSRQNPEWAFGTQSSGNCRVDQGGTGVKRTRFECLCARQVAC